MTSEQQDRSSLSSIVFSPGVAFVVTVVLALGAYLLYDVEAAGRMAALGASVVVAIMFRRHGRSVGSDVDPMAGGELRVLGWLVPPTRTLFINTVLLSVAAYFALGRYAANAIAVLGAALLTWAAFRRQSTR